MGDTSLPERDALEQRVAEHRVQVDEQIKHVRNLSLFFVTTCLYILVAVATTTHMDLLLGGKSLILPVINVGIPITNFYFSAPFIVVLLHLNLLLRHYFLALKTRDFAEAAALLGRDESPAAPPHDLRLGTSAATPAHGGRTFDDEIRSLHPSPFIYTLLPSIHPRYVSGAFHLIDLALLAGLPLGVLLFTQIQFLPYHSYPITLAHQTAVMADVLLLMFFVSSIAPPEPPDTSRRRLHGWRRAWQLTWVYTVAGVFFLALTAAVCAGLYYVLTAWASRQAGLATLLGPWQWIGFAVYVAFFAAIAFAVCAYAPPPIGFLTRHDGRFGIESRFALAAMPSLIVLNFSVAFATVPETPWSPLYAVYPASEETLDRLFTRYLDVSRQLIVAEESPPEIIAAYLQQGKSKEDAIRAESKPANLTGRDLRRANFAASRLPRAILVSANLSGADLSETELHNADLSLAQVHGAHLFQARLSGANLFRAELHGADLLGAQMHGADLSLAQLHGASLFQAQLHGADLTLAELHGTYLSQAQLHGADLRLARLHGANLFRAALLGADLNLAQLHGADLRGAQLPYCDWTDVSIECADFRDAQFSANDEDVARLAATRALLADLDSDAARAAIERLSNPKDNLTTLLQTPPKAVSLYDTDGELATAWGVPDRSAWIEALKPTLGAAARVHLASTRNIVALFGDVVGARDCAPAECVAELESLRECLSSDAPEIRLSSSECAEVVQEIDAALARLKAQ